MSAPQIPPPASAAPSTPSGAAGLIALPSEIIRLPQELAARLLIGLRTVFVSGTVTGQGADGALQIRSQFGDIAVRAGTTVPTDRQVSLQIPPLTHKAANLTAPQLSRSPIPASLLLSKPAASPAAPASPEAPASTAGPLADARAPAATAPLPPSPPTAAPPPSTLAAGQTPTSAPSTATSAPSLQGSGVAQPTQAVSNPAPSAAASAPQAGSSAPATLADRPASSLQAAPPASGSSPPPSSTQNTAAPPLGRLTLAAQLLTQTGERPAVATAAPQVRAAALQPQSAAPQTSTAPTASPVSSPSTHPAAAATDGVRIAANITRGLLAPPVAGRENSRDAIPSDSIRRVPALREAVSVLGAADPTLATRFVRSILPQANTQLAATLLFFLSATRSGDIRGWMGDRVTSILDDAGRADLLPKLSAELAAPARPMPDAAAGDWRSQTTPFYQDGNIGGMAVHVRPTGDEDGAAGEGEAGGHRFLIDMDLSRMGPLQFDGLVRDKRFDLIIRTQAAFPEPMRQDMRILFRDASDIVGLHGGLTFQAGGHDWVAVAATRGGS